MSLQSGYSDYENKVVIDVNQLELGKIVDFTLDPKEYEIVHFVVEGDNDVLKEYFEIESKYKLLMPKDNIRRRSKTGDVILNCEAKELPHIADLPDNVIRFSSVRSADVLAKDREDVGRVIDVLIHADNHISFILGGSPFHEFLGKIGLKEKLHLLLPYRYIDKMNGNLIIMSKDKSDLGQVLNNVVLDSDGKRLMDEREKYSKESRLLLYKESYQDVFQGNEKSSY